MGHRLGGVALAVEQHPHAERAARDRDDRAPRRAPAAHRRARTGRAASRASVRVVARPRPPARRRRARRARRRRCAQHVGGQRVRRARRTRSARRSGTRRGPHRRACSMSCVATSSTRPSARSSLEHRLDARGARRVHARQRLVEQDHRASWSSARAISTRWRCPPDSAPKRARARSARPTRSSTARAASRSRARHPPPRRRARVRAHEHDVERGDGEVEPRAVGLRHVGGRRVELDGPRARTGSSPSSARNSVVLPPPLGPSTAATVPASSANATPGALAPAA